jgi:hypothetical protein
MKEYYVNVAAGLGFNMAFCSWATQYKKEHPNEVKFYVTSPYVDLFESCDAIDGVYKPNEIRDFIFDAKANGGTLVMQRLYDMDGFIKKELNYSEAWSDLLGLPRLEKPVTANFENAKVKFPNVINQKNEILKAINKFDDFIIVQFWGGQSPLVQVPVGQDEKGNKFPDWRQVPYNYENEPLRRHYPIEKAQKFVELYMKEHPKTAIIQYSLPNEPMLQGDNIVHATVPYLCYYELAKDDKCKGIVSIDSSLPHLTAGLTKTVVIWAHSEPQAFGYEYNHNIIQRCNRNDILYFSALGASAAKVDYIAPEELLKEVDDYLEGNNGKYVLGVAGNESEAD